LTNDARAGDDPLAYRRYRRARSAADEGDWRAVAETFRAPLGAEPSDAKGAAARPASVGLRKDRQTPRRIAVAKAATAIPFRREAIHEQGERPW